MVGLFFLICCNGAESIFETHGQSIARLFHYPLLILFLLSVTATKMVPWWMTEEPLPKCLSVSNRSPLILTAQYLSPALLFLITCLPLWIAKLFAVTYGTSLLFQSRRLVALNSTLSHFSSSFIQSVGSSQEKTFCWPSNQEAVSRWALCPSVSCWKTVTVPLKYGTSFSCYRKWLDLVYIIKLHVCFNIIECPLK